MDLGGEHARFHRLAHYSLLTHSLLATPYYTLRILTTHHPPPTTHQGVLEYYWGEHIHLGWYAEGQRKGPFYGGKDFIEAKYDFTEKMLEFSKTDMPAKVLDVGCGIGGTSRYGANKSEPCSLRPSLYA